MTKKSLQPTPKKVSVSIISQKHMDDSEINFFKRWFNEEFGHMDIEWAPPQWYTIMRYKHDIIGVIGILKRNVRVGTSSVLVGGLCNVIIKKQMRGKKLLKPMMDKTVEFIRDTLGVEFGFLLCRDEVVPIYRKLNWQLTEYPTFYTQSTGIGTYSKNSMFLPLIDRSWPRGDIFLEGLPW